MQHIVTSEQKERLERSFEEARNGEGVSRERAHIMMQNFMQNHLQEEWV